MMAFLSEKLTMHGYGFYVWLAYGATFFLMIALRMGTRTTCTLKEKND